MDKDRRLALLEEIGSQLCGRDSANMSQAVMGRPIRSRNLDCLEVVFKDTEGEELGRLSLVRAIYSLAGDVYLFHDFDLTEAESAAVVDI